MNKRNYLATIVYDAHGADGASDEMIPRLSEIIRDVEGEVTKVEIREAMTLPILKARK